MSQLSTKLDTYFPRTVGMHRLTRLASGAQRVQVFIDRKSIDLGTYGLLLRKEGDGVAMACNLARIRRDPWLVAPFTRRPAAVIALFAATDDDIRRCRAESSDGWESGPGTVSFCSVHPDAILIPDAEFYISRGYASVRRLAQEASVPWRERGDVVLWRGSSTGPGKVAEEDMTPANRNLIQRTRLCLLLRGVAGADVRLINAVQTDDPADARRRLAAAGVLGGAPEPCAWLAHKFALDLDGNSNTWSNLFTRLLLGCCVIKVASPQGYRQWYYGDLVAWRHYVPVKADMSDLVEKIDWCRSHGAECAAIAAAGQALAMTFERETAQGIAKGSSGNKRFARLV
jgi:hypothetical protein